MTRRPGNRPPRSRAQLACGWSWPPGPCFVVAGVAIGALTGLFGVRRLLDRDAVAGGPWGARAACGGVAPARDDPGGARSCWTLHPEPGGQAASCGVDAPGRPAGRDRGRLAVGRGRRSDVADRLRRRPRVRRSTGPSSRSSGPHAARATVRRKNRLLLGGRIRAGVGLFTGLLANGGGFLLVPMYLLVFGLTMRESAGTSLLVDRHPRRPHARHALGPRSHRLDGGRGVRARRDTLPASRAVDGRTTSKERVSAARSAGSSSARASPSSSPGSSEPEERSMEAAIGSSLVQPSAHRGRRAAIASSRGSSCSCSLSLLAAVSLLPGGKRLDHSRLAVRWSSRSLDPGSGRRGDQPG